MAWWAGRKSWWASWSATGAHFGRLPIKNSSSMAAEGAGRIRESLFLFYTFSMRVQIRQVFIHTTWVHRNLLSDFIHPPSCISQLIKFAKVRGVLPLILARTLFEYKVTAKIWKLYKVYFSNILWNTPYDKVNGIGESCFAWMLVGHSGLPLESLSVGCARVYVFCCNSCSPLKTVHPTTD